MSQGPPHINQCHRQELVDSGISPAIADLNFWTVEDPEEVDRILSRNASRRWKHSEDLVPGWAVAGVDPETGERNLLGAQFKPDNPQPQLGDDGKPKLNPDGTPKVRKYESASGYPAEPLFLDIGEDGYWSRILSDSSIPLLITEGAKKQAAGLSHGFTSVSIPGVACGQKLGRLKPNIEKFCGLGRTVYLAFDSDLHDNPNVRKALDKLGRLIAACGAVVKIAVLPEDGAQGLDDFLVAEGREAFAEILEEAPTFEEWRSEAGGVGEADKPKKESQATLLVKLAGDLGLDLFHTPDDREGYADVRINGNRATYKLRSRDFRDWLNRQFYLKHGKAAGAQGMQDALATLDGKAKFEGPQRQVFIRLATHDGVIYLDPGTDDWSAIAISALGWQAVQEPPVRFRRPKGQLALPMPEPGGTIADLRNAINVDETDWPLVAAWLLFCLNPENPKPILMLLGEQGSGKSCAARLLRGLIDPAKGGLRPEPGDNRNLAIAASNNWMLAFDNLSHVSPQVSDALCRLATGGGFAVRTLYTDDEETIFEATRPVILTGITELANRSDLLDRMLLINLPVIAQEDRQTEAAISADFERLKPKLLGALLEAAASTLSKLPQVNPTALPRMADFARWGIAGEAALGLEEGDFMRSYQENREGANESVMEGSPVATALLKFMEARIRWEGTASDLLAELAQVTTEETRKNRSWPHGARALGSHLKRLAPNLRAAGLNLTRGNRASDSKGSRIITLERTGNFASETSEAPIRSPEPPDSSAFASDKQENDLRQRTSEAQQFASENGFASENKDFASEAQSLPVRDFQLFSDVSDVSDKQNPTHSNGRIKPGDKVSKRHKRGWVGQVTEIQDEYANVVWCGAKLAVREPVSDLRGAS